MITLGTQYYAIFYPDEHAGYHFLDSEKANVITNRHPSVDSIYNGGDKGLRWKFLSGKGNDGFLATQAHGNKLVGYDASDNEFHANFRTDNHDTAVMVHFINSTHISMCYEKNCIGEGGRKTEKKFVWKIEQLKQA